MKTSRNVPPPRPTDCVAGVLVGGASRRMGRSKAMLRLPGGMTLIEHVVSVVQSAVGETVILGQTEALPPSVEPLKQLPDDQPGAGPLAGLCSLLNYAAPRWGLLVACDMPALSPDVVAFLLSHRHPDIDAVAFVQSRAGNTTCSAERPDRPQGDAVPHTPPDTPIRTSGMPTRTTPTALNAPPDRSSAQPNAADAPPDTPNAPPEARSGGKHPRPDAAGPAPVFFHTCCACYHPRILPVCRAVLEREGGRMQRLLARIRVRSLTPNDAQAIQLANVNTPDDLERMVHRRP